MASLSSPGGKSNFTLPQEESGRVRKNTTSGGGPERRGAAKKKSGEKLKDVRLAKGREKEIRIGRPNYMEENEIRWLNIILAGEFQTAHFAGIINRR